MINRVGLVAAAVLLACGLLTAGCTGGTLESSTATKSTPDFPEPVTDTFYNSGYVRQTPEGELYYYDKGAEVVRDMPGPPAYPFGSYSVRAEKLPGVGVQLLSETGERPPPSVPINSCNAADPQLLAAMHSVGSMKIGEQAYAYGPLLEGSDGVILSRLSPTSPQRDESFDVLVARRADGYVAFANNADPGYTKWESRYGELEEFVDVTIVALPGEITAANNYYHHHSASLGEIGDLPVDASGFVDTDAVWTTPDGRCFIDADADVYTQPYGYHYGTVKTAIMRTPEGLIAQANFLRVLAPAAGGIAIDPERAKDEPPTPGLLLPGHKIGVGYDAFGHVGDQFFILKDYMSSAWAKDYPYVVENQDGKLIITPSPDNQQLYMIDYTVPTDQAGEYQSVTLEFEPVLK